MCAFREVQRTAEANHLGSRSIPLSIQEKTMTLKCPVCRSRNIETLDYGKKTGATIGIVGGAASGAAGAMSGARLGASVGAMVGPVGIGIGGITGAIIGALLGGTAGGAAGAKIGQVIDERYLDNYHCLNCGHSFDTESAVQVEEAPRALPPRR
jgi:DNA-directed RNA polymerase subunit RPC12/RpoP